jgi:hypothetical protein
MANDEQQVKKPVSFRGATVRFSTLTPVSMRSADRANPESLEFTNSSGLMSA